MDCGGWALIYDPGQKRLMLLVELGGSAWRSNIYQTVRSLFVEADHPVPQRLAVHTTSFRCLFPRCSVEDRSDRQKPTCLRRVLCPFGQTANFGARIVCFHCNRSTHDKPPSVCQVESFRERFGNPCLIMRIYEEFALSVSDDTIYRAMKELGFSHVSARPKAYKQDAEAMDAFKKTFLRASPKSARSSHRAHR